MAVRNAGNGREARPQLEVRPRRRRRDLLESMSKDALVGMILRLEARFKRLEPAAETLDTQILKTSEAVAPNLGMLSFVQSHGVTTFHELPQKFELKENEEDITWRLVLVSANMHKQPLGLAIHDDVVVGRGLTPGTPYLDLSAYDAEALGMSRRHALLRPSRYSLFLIDLGSKNGTFWNAVRLGAGTAQRLKDNDVLSFGKLHFQLQLVSGPAVLPFSGD